MSEQVYHKVDIEYKPDDLMRSRARMTIAGGVITIQSSTRMGCDPTVVRHDAQHYRVISTGELIDMERKAQSRLDNTDSLRRSMATLRDIINANFGCAAPTQAQAWLTLTYRENVRDSQRVADDYEAFMRWLRRRVGAAVEYITVIEPQRRGAWHLHALLFRPDGERLYVPQKELLKAWRDIAARRTPPDLLTDAAGRKLSAGGLHVHRLADAGDNVGAYLSAYLTDEAGSKGARLSLYPAGIQYYRCSRGVKRPEVREYARLRDAIADARCLTAAAPHYDKTYIIEDDKGHELQAGAYIQLKRRRDDGGA